MKDGRHSDPQSSHNQYWKKNIALIRKLLIIWALVSYVPVVFLGELLHNVKFFGVTLSFWFAQQGSMIVFVCLIFYYAWRMDKFDKDYGIHEENEKRGEVK